MPEDRTLRTGPDLRFLLSGWGDLNSRPSVPQTADLPKHHASYHHPDKGGDCHGDHDYHHHGARRATASTPAATPISRASTTRDGPSPIAMATTRAENRAAGNSTVTGASRSARRSPATTPTNLKALPTQDRSNECDQVSVGDGPEPFGHLAMYLSHRSLPVAGPVESGKRHRESPIRGTSPRSEIRTPQGGSESSVAEGCRYSNRT